MRLFTQSELDTIRDNDEVRNRCRDWAKAQRQAELGLAHEMEEPIAICEQGVRAAICRAVRDDSLDAHFWLELGGWQDHPNGEFDASVGLYLNDSQDFGLTL